MERTLACLRRYRSAMDRHDVAAVRATATSAVRDSANRRDFLDAAASVVGAPLEVLPGPEEAALSFQGAVSDLDPADGPFLVVDIGGGSTELAYGAAGLESALSLDIGSVRLTEKYLEGDPPRPDELSACLSVVGLHLDDAVRAMGGTLADARLVGVAGTISTAAAVEMGLAEYDRDRLHHLPAVQGRRGGRVPHSGHRAAGCPCAQSRLGAGQSGRDRGRIVHPGADHAPLRFEQCLVSERDLLDGMALSLLGS